MRLLQLLLPAAGILSCCGFSGRHSEVDHEVLYSFKPETFPEEPGGSGLLSLVVILVIVILPFLIYNYRKRTKGEDSPIKSLSIQERRVFSMIQQGFSNKEISDELGISLSTVKTLVNNIYSKLKISSRKEAIDYR